jgi:hypothetical protein
MVTEVKGAPDTGTVLAMVLGIAVVLVVAAAAVYMAHTRHRVRWRSQHPDTSLPVVDQLRHAQARVQVPSTRVAPASLPPGAARTPVSNNPIIDQIDFEQAAPIDSEAIAKLVGLPSSASGRPEAVVMAPHGEHSSTVVPSQLRHPDTGAPCIASVIVFTDTGGGVQFKFFPVLVPGAARRAVAWFNAFPGGRPDPRTLFSLAPGTRAVVTHFFGSPAS